MKNFFETSQGKNEPGEKELSGFQSLGRGAGKEGSKNGGKNEKKIQNRSRKIARGFLSQDKWSPLNLSSV